MPKGNLAGGDGSDTATSGDDSAAAGSDDDSDKSGFVNDCDTADSCDGRGAALRSGNVHIGPGSAGQEDPATDPSDSNSGGIGAELARWLAPSAVGGSADSRGARRSATEDLDELVGELVHVHQPRAAAPTRTAAHAKGNNRAGSAGPLSRSWKGGTNNGGAWASRCSETSAKRSLSHFCCHSASLSVCRHAAHSRACTTMSTAGASPSICAIFDWTSWQFITRYVQRRSLELFSELSVRVIQPGFHRSKWHS